MNTTLMQQVEGLLYALGRPVSFQNLASMTGTSVEEMIEIVTQLSTQKDRGVVIVHTDTNAELRVTPEVAPLVEQMRRQENTRDIGRAGLEVISAILYKGPQTRSEIDFMRGVNSSQILRTLTMRGLVRKKVNPKDERSVLYEATTELLATMGATHPRDLPEFEQIKEKFSQLETTYKAQMSGESETE